MAQFVMGGIPYVFTPGRIGELTQVISPELVEAVAEETGAREKRLRSLPSRVGVYFGMALDPCEYLAAQLVWDNLVAGLSSNVPQPSEKALRDLRRQVGVAPLQRLFEVLSGPLAHPSTQDALPPLAHCRQPVGSDHERNRSWLCRTV